jgi:hypothetical protein
MFGNDSNLVAVERRLAAPRDTIPGVCAFTKEVTLKAIKRNLQADFVFGG